ncbi:MAG: trehalose-phosphatase [Desulfuromonadales bacterium]|nr:trehalose-phosphatase [Desulfuromonadales bacterium]
MTNSENSHFFLDPQYYDAVIFDLDGVITRTASVHAAAWKRLFDDYLQQRGERSGDEFSPFEIETDYRLYVDGIPRYEGVRKFLASREIVLPWGSPDNAPGMETVCGLGNRKNEYFQKHLKENGVEVYPGTVDLLFRLREAGVRRGVISASRNCQAVLQAAGLEELFEARVDGVVAEELQLPGKPAPDVFLEAARRLEARPARSVIVEDALAGVEAGAAGQFACVIGVDRTGHGSDLRQSGADVVVADLAQVSMPLQQQPAEGLPRVLDRLPELTLRLAGRQPAVFLDYDGVLTPIVPRPEQAVITPAMRQAVRTLAERCPVAVVSGRDLPDVRQMVGIEEIVYAGSHGFDIAGPAGAHLEYAQGVDYLPRLEQAQAQLTERLAPLTNARLERKRFAVAIHFREVAPEQVAAVEKAVDEVLAAVGGLRKTGGKKIFELRPDIDWDKGKAVQFLLERLGLDRPEIMPIYLGDDLTDEDAFCGLQGRGLGLLVRDEPRPTCAVYAFEGSGEVERFLVGLAARLEGEGR